MSGQKLVIVIARAHDAEALMRKLVQEGHSATELGSTDSFFTTGKTTIMCCVHSNDVEAVISLARQECRVRRENIPPMDRPGFGGVIFQKLQTVTVGGALVYVVPCEPVPDQ